MFTENSIKNFEKHFCN